MNREEAQFILGAYRPNNEDAHDPQFQDALALARQDPVLAQWFAEQQALDRAFAAQLRSRPIPSDLKGRLLLARNTGVCTPRWRQPAWIAAAACFALLFITAGSLLLRRSARIAEFDEFRSAMAVASLDLTNHFDVVGLDPDGYRRWLAEHHAVPDFVLPPGLAEKGIMACKVVEWQQRRVTMLCLKSAGRHVDVFVVNASELPAPSVDANPAFFADGGVTTSVWRRDGKIYVAASPIPKADLQQLL